MTWTELKLIVKNRLQFDGVSSQNLDNTVLASAFDLRAKIYLQSFVHDTLYIFQDRAALTLAINDLEVNLLDSGKCAKPIFKPHRVWVNNVRLEYYSPSDIMDATSAAAYSTGAPSAFTFSREGYIQFNKKLDSAYSNSAVSGWAKHTEISSDSQTIEVQEWDCLILAAYMAAGFAQPVASSNVDLNRLKMYDEEAFKGAVRILEANKARFFGP